MKIHSPALHNQFVDIGKAATSLWNTLITGQTHPWRSQTITVQPNGKIPGQWKQWTSPSTTNGHTRTNTHTQTNPQAISSTQQPLFTANGKIHQQQMQWQPNTWQTLMAHNTGNQHNGHGNFGKNTKGYTQTGNITRLTYEQQMAPPCTHQDPMD